MNPIESAIDEQLMSVDPERLNRKRGTQTILIKMIDRLEKGPKPKRKRKRNRRRRILVSS